MIYVDTSVLLAELLAEDRTPPAALWRQPLVASRLVEYEVWNRLHAKDLGRSHGEQAGLLVGRIALLELAPPVLARALEPYPTAVRTLDALHLASVDFLRSQGLKLRLATYDERLSEAARRMKIPLFPL